MHNDAFAAVLPAVAVGTMMDGATVEFPQAGERRQFVHHAGRKQEAATDEGTSVGKTDPKFFLAALAMDCFAAGDLYIRIALQLFAGDPGEFSRICAIPAQEAVHLP